MLLVRFAMITVGLCCVSACGIRDLTYSNPPVYFAYPSGIAVIKDQSKVATLIIRGGAGGLSIDGVRVTNENTPLRSVNRSSFKAAVAIDVLEMGYTTEFSPVVIAKRYDERYNRMVHHSGLDQYLFETIDKRAGLCCKVVLDLNNEQSNMAQTGLPRL